MSTPALTVFGIALADLTPEALLHYSLESRRLTRVFHGTATLGAYAGGRAWPSSTRWATPPPRPPRACGPPLSRDSTPSKNSSTASGCATRTSATSSSTTSAAAPPSWTTPPLTR